MIYGWMVVSPTQIRQHNNRLFGNIVFHFVRIHGNCQSLPNQSDFIGNITIRKTEKTTWPTLNFRLWGNLMVIVQSNLYLPVQYSTIHYMKLSYDCNLRIVIAIDTYLVFHAVWINVVLTSVEACDARPHNILRLITPVQISRDNFVSRIFQIFNEFNLIRDNPSVF